MVKQCYQKRQKDKNWWKMPKLKKSNATFWGNFQTVSAKKWSQKVYSLTKD